MTDIVDKATRSRMMSGIKNKNTKPELEIRTALFKHGFRYRLHVGHLPGKPDLVFPKYRAVIFVHGCFWHGHQCRLFKWPKTRKQFWKKKILRNRVVDKKSVTLLLDMGLRVLTVWECALKGPKRLELSGIVRKISSWLYSNQLDKTINISGRKK